MPIEDLAGNDASDFSNQSATNSSAGGVCIAFLDDALEPDPTWTRIDDPNGINIVRSWSIDRGRSSELDKTHTGTATINLMDQQGVMDPTNSSSPILNLGPNSFIDPMKQVCINLKHPITGVWYSEFRGFIDDIQMSLDVAENVFTGTVSCVGPFAYLGAVEVTPDNGSAYSAGTPAGRVVPVPTDSAGDVFYENGSVDDRIRAGFADALWPSARTVVFSGNVMVQKTVYAVRSYILQVLQDAADAENPLIANLYEDRLGRVVFHGRISRADPVGVSQSAGTAVWDFHHWKSGDNSAWSGDATVAPISNLTFNRSLAFVINAALATPQNIADAQIVNGLSFDSGSIATYGVRSASYENLINGNGKDDGLNKEEEAASYSAYATANYSAPRNRIATLAFKNVRRGHPNESYLWSLLCQADISDWIDVVTSHPGGGFFNETFFIEGVRMSADHLGEDDYHLVEVEYDLSPQAFFTSVPAGPNSVQRTIQTQLVVRRDQVSTPTPRTQSGT